jgi:hypothetical protein
VSSIPGDVSRRFAPQRDRGVKDVVLTASFLIRLPFAVGASARLENNALSVEPGAAAVVRIKIQNTGQVVDEFTFQVLGDAAAWAAVAPATIPLFPGRDEIATVTFRPPRTPEVAAGPVHFGVRVVSREDPQGSVVEEGVLTVGAFADSAAELVPKNSRGSRSALHEVAVDNRGNGQMQVALSATDKDKLLNFNINPASLVVAPGTVGFARLKVQPRQTFFRGSPKSRQFQVGVQPAGQPPIVLDGTMVQGPLLAPWMIPVALGVLAAVVVLALLWFLAVKPGIESVARAAVATPSASGGSNPGGGGHSPSTGGSTPTPTGSGSGGGIDFSQRLAPASGPTYKSPASTTLYITDLVFNNPAGESGNISLNRDGVALLVENMNNFRDLDYHFVTPIQVNAGSTIQLAGSCSACSVLVSGYEKTS